MSNIPESKPKHPGGRPTKYKPEYCEQIVQYFDKPTTRTEYKREYFANGELKAEVPILIANEFPTFQGFAHEIGVDMSQLTRWQNEYIEFRTAYARAKDLQERIWLSNSMQNLYNSQFAQFFGKNCLGYKDKAEIEHTGQIGAAVPEWVSSLTPEQLERLLKAAQDDA